MVFNTAGLQQGMFSTDTCQNKVNDMLVCVM